MSEKTKHIDTITDAFAQSDLHFVDSREDDASLIEELFSFEKTSLVKESQSMSYNYMEFPDAAPDRRLEEPAAAGTYDHRRTTPRRTVRKRPDNSDKTNARNHDPRKLELIQIPEPKDIERVLSPEIEEKIQKVINTLVMEGIPMDMIREWLDQHTYISRMTITSKHRIILNDFQDLVITMGPLPKTVFLFYLRHPEGIAFADLMDYSDELLDIYGSLSAKDNLEEMQESISHLTDPFDNSINEKCSAVKAAFTKKLSPATARHYCIAGHQGEKKYIPLDRNLVHWE